MQMLQSYFAQVQSGRMAFTQTVSTPSRTPGEAARQRKSSGSFEFSRPGRFRFSYQKPFEQELVSDGQTLWQYDVDLAQATARSLAATLAGTPAALLASGADLKTLSTSFALQDLPSEGGLVWLAATPKPAAGSEGQIQRLEIGFKPAAAAPELAQLVLFDSFGQRSQIYFGPLEAAKPAASRFAFTPPKGVDVIRQ